MTIIEGLELSTQYHIVARIHLQCAQWRRKMFSSRGAETWCMKPRVERLSIFKYNIWLPILLHIWAERSALLQAAHPG